MWNFKIQISKRRKRRPSLSQALIKIKRKARSFLSARWTLKWHNLKTKKDFLTLVDMYEKILNIRWWRCPHPSSPSFTLPHPNSWLETLNAKIIEYAVFQLSLSQWFVFVETSREYFKDFGGLMKRFDSETRYFMFSTINSFKSTIEAFFN